MAAFGTPEILIIAVVVMTLFGARRLPDSARALGRSMRIFKAETKGLHDDDSVEPVAPSAPMLAAPAPAAAAPLFDAYTGKQLGPPQPMFDPMTGRPLGAPQHDTQP